MSNILEVMTTDRLTLRVPRDGDGPMINATVLASLSELKHWWPWAKTPPSVADSEVIARRDRALFEGRKKLSYLMIAKDLDSHVGSLALGHIDWAIPTGDFGYFLGSPYVGRGYMTEAVKHLTTYAISTLGFNRLEIRMDAKNLRSRNVAERSGYIFESAQRNSARNVAGELADMCIYAIYSNMQSKDTVSAI